MSLVVECTTNRRALDISRDSDIIAKSTVSETASHQSSQRSRMDFFLSSACQDLDSLFVERDAIVHLSCQSTQSSRPAEAGIRHFTFHKSQTAKYEYRILITRGGVLYLLLASGSRGYSDYSDGLYNTLTFFYCHSSANQIDQAVMDVHEGEHCLTEVLLPCIPFMERHQRLHSHLPASPYSYGAIYTPIEDTAELRPTGETNTVVATKSNSVPPAILLLKGQFSFRFGGQVERAFSPPLSWTHEELCGKPFLYYARDLRHLSSVARPRLHPQRSSMVISTALPPQANRGNQLANEVWSDSAARIMRFGFCSTAAIDYFRANPMSGLPEWLSEDWYESTEPGELPRVPGALHFICIRSFDTTVNLGRAAALISGSMLAMDMHNPELQWCMGTYQLEGSVVHQKMPEHTQEPLHGWFGPATARMEARPPADSLANRQRVSFSACPSPQPRLIPLGSLTNPQQNGKADSKHEIDDANDHYLQDSRTKILKTLSSQPPTKRSRGGSLRLTLRPNAREG